MQAVRHMYHDPRHTPMKTHAPLKVVNELMGTRSEADRPLLRRIRHPGRHPPGCSTQVRFRCASKARTAK